MNLELFKRNLSLYKLSISELNSYESRIYNLLVENISELKPFIEDNHRNYVFFGKSPEHIIYRYNIHEKYLHVDFNTFKLFDVMLAHGYIKSLLNLWFTYTIDLNFNEATKIPPLKPKLWYLI